MGSSARILKNRKKKKPKPFINQHSWGLLTLHSMKDSGVTAVPSNLFCLIISSSSLAPAFRDMVLCTKQPQDDVMMMSQSDHSATSANIPYIYGGGLTIAFSSSLFFCCSFMCMRFNISACMDPSYVFVCMYMGGHQINGR